MSTDRDLRSMVRLMPGVYDDGRGGLHLVLGELLEGAGYPDTPENRAMLLAEWRGWAQGQSVTIVEAS
jgi:hypothetical protein